MTLERTSPSLVSVLLAAACGIDDRTTAVVLPSDTNVDTMNADVKPGCGPGFPFDLAANDNLMPAVRPEIAPPTDASYLGVVNFTAEDTFACVANSISGHDELRWLARWGELSDCGSLAWEPKVLRLELSQGRTLVATPVKHISTSEDEPELAGDSWLLQVKPPLPSDVPDVGWLVATGKSTSIPAACEAGTPPQTRRFVGSFDVYAN